MMKHEFLPNGMVLFQSDKAFRLGQDSVLLGSFANPRKRDRVLDLCAGTGALALMQHNGFRALHALELCEAPLALLARAAAENKVDIHVQQGDLREIQRFYARGSMDYVICNPPYFQAGAGKHAQGETSIARQDDSAGIEDVARAIAYVLTGSGRCSVVFRPERLLSLLHAFENVQLMAKRMRFIHQNASIQPSAVMVEFKHNARREGLVVEAPLLVESDEYQKIYRGDAMI